MFPDPDRVVTESDGPEEQVTTEVEGDTRVLERVGSVPDRVSPPRVELELPEVGQEVKEVRGGVCVPDPIFHSIRPPLTGPRAGRWGAGRVGVECPEDLEPVEEDPQQNVEWGLTRVEEVSEDLPEAPTHRGDVVGDREDVGVVLCVEHLSPDDHGPVNTTETGGRDLDVSGTPGRRTRTR